MTTTRSIPCITRLGNRQDTMGMRTASRGAGGGQAKGQRFANAFDILGDADQEEPFARAAQRKRKGGKRKEQAVVEVEGHVAVLTAPPAPVVVGSVSGDEESVFHALDDFLLSTVLRWLGHAPSLDRARAVCRRWRAVIDAEKRLWKDLLWRQFRWKKKGQGRRSKKKTMNKNKMIPAVKEEDNDYRSIYIQTYRENREKEAAKQLQAKNHMIKLSRLLRTIMLCKFERDCSHIDRAHPWMKCKHEPEWLVVITRSLFLPTSPVPWCECKACGVRLSITDAERWLELWPDILDVTSSSRAGRNRLWGFAWALTVDVSNNRAKEAYAIYAEFCQHHVTGASATASASPQEQVSQ